MTFANSAVKDAYRAFPAEIRQRLLEVRAIIFDVAAHTKGVGKIEETLKWREPSYLTSQTGSGTTIRLSSVKNSPDKFGIYFNCQTTLINDFRVLYPNEFEFDGKRALLFGIDQQLPIEPLKHCIALAQTYHLRKKITKDARP